MYLIKCTIANEIFFVCHSNERELSLKARDASLFEIEEVRETIAQAALAWSGFYEIIWVA